MRLSWNEIKRAPRVCREWKDAHYERGESQTFYNEFFEVFGVTRRRVASFEEPVKRLGNQRGSSICFGRVCCWWSRRARAGTSFAPRRQALDYFPGLKENELPRYILVSDFQIFELYDLEDDTSIRFKLRSSRST